MPDFPIDVRLIEKADELEYDMWAYAKSPFKRTPSLFVEDAFLDLAEESERGNLNAFHNAKRALECQTDWIIWNLGLTKPKASSIPAKFAELDKVGAAPPLILRKIIRDRNLLEHEYESADRSSAEDAVDIAHLFIRATKDLAPIRYSDWNFWSSASRIGGSFNFAYVSKEEISFEDAWISEFTNREDPPTAVYYRFHRSNRTDRLDPELYSDEGELNKEREWLGEGAVLKEQTELYLGFVRAMVRRATQRGD